MKNFFQLMYINIKRMLKDPGKIGFMLVMPFLVILFVNFTTNTTHSSGGSSNVSVAYNIEDKGETWKSVFPYLIEDQNTFINEREKALELLEKGDVSAVYNIPSDFSEVISNYVNPNIKAYKIENGNTTIPIEMRLNRDIDKWIEGEVLTNNGVVSNIDELSMSNIEITFVKDGTEIEGDINVATIMLIYFIILGASFIGPELIELKEKNIISRAITTPNKSSSILGSLASSILFLQVSINMFIFFLGKVLLDYQVFHIHIIFINIVLASLFSITLSLAATRIFKNAGVVSLVTALVSILTLFLSMFAQGVYPNMPKFIENLGKFTPQYWIFDSLEKSILFPNAFIVLLMVIALFTAGSYKLKDF